MGSQERRDTLESKASLTKNSPKMAKPALKISQIGAGAMTNSNIGDSLY